MFIHKSKILGHSFALTVGKKQNGFKYVLRSSTYKSNAFPSENKSSRASNNKYACQSVHVGTLRKGPTVPVIVRACVWVLLSGAANDDRHRVSSATSPFLQIRK
eukprot:GEMP01099648.1.p3 GENE.GEMP01099648.1~~GEMP01099648.1.p3  ORF type:complete len:104 (-),score=11.20 GEMP01099648.1:189-500(-)